MKRGFTLVELLAVLVILSLLSLITVPVVDKLIKDNKEKMYDIQIKNIEDGAKDWAAANPFSMPEDGESITKTIKELEDGGFIEVDIKNPKTNEVFCDTSYVKITNKNNVYSYTYDPDNGNC